METPLLSDVDLSLQPLFFGVQRPILYTFYRNHSDLLLRTLILLKTPCAIAAALGEILLILCTGILPFTYTGIGFILSSSISHPASLLIFSEAALLKSRMASLSTAGAALLALPLAAI